MFTAGRLLSTYQAFNKYFLKKYCLNPPQNYKLRESRDFKWLICQFITAFSIEIMIKEAYQNPFTYWKYLLPRNNKKISDLCKIQTHYLSPIKTCANEPRSFSMHIIIKSHSQTKISRNIKYCPDLISVRVPSRYAKLVGSIPNQGTEKDQHLNS